MENIERIPSEVIASIPIFDGDTRMLPLFIKKCNSVLETFGGSQAQNGYIYYIITGRLAGQAAYLIGEREIDNWTQLKQLLNQHFGDPRSVACLAMELENIKIRSNENFVDFCHRIQQLRSVLFSKIDETINDVSIRTIQKNIYTDKSLNVFIFNLPYKLAESVQGTANTLEEALKIVLEKQNFRSIYFNKAETFPNRSFRPNYNRFNNNFASSRNSVGQQLSSAFAPNSSNNAFDSRNRASYSGQFKNNNYNRQNYNQLQNASRAPFPRRPTNFTHGQQYDARAHVPHAAQNLPVSNNTDVTMRTASSRRINYLDYSDNNQPCTSQQCDYNSNAQQFNQGSSNPNAVENFYTEASYIKKK